MVKKIVRLHKITVYDVMNPIHSNPQYLWEIWWVGVKIRVCLKIGYPWLPRLPSTGLDSNKSNMFHIVFSVELPQFSGR